MCHNVKLAHHFVSRCIVQLVSDFMKLSLCSMIVSPVLFPWKAGMHFSCLVFPVTASPLTLTEAPSFSIFYKLFYQHNSWLTFYCLFFLTCALCMWTGSWCCCKTCMTDMCATRCLWLRVRRTSGKTTLWADRDSTPRTVSGRKFWRPLRVK